MNSDLMLLNHIIPAMSDAEIEKVTDLENEAFKYPQLAIEIQHIFHAGVYARTAILPENTMITGALLKVPTILIVNGDCTIFVGHETRRLTGYHVFSAAANRKQAFVAHKRTELTMLYATEYTTVEQVEQEFTDDFLKLNSRTTGGQCPAL